MRCIIPYDRYFRRERYQEDQSSNGNSFDYGNPDCEHTGNYGHAFVLVLWDAAGIHIASHSTLKGVKLSSKGIIAGVIAALAIGLPVFAYGSILNSGPYKTLGSLLTVILSGVIALASSRKSLNDIK